MNNLTEIWKDIKSWEGLYQVSNFGRVKSLRYERILKPNKPRRGNNRTGYCHVILCDRNRRVSAKVNKLVAEAFVPNPNNLPTVRYIDGNKMNNNASNLIWSTHKDNTAHAIELGNVNHNGENSALSRYTENTIQSIRREFDKGGVTKKALSDKYGMSYTNVLRIINRDIWNHI